MAFKGTNAVFNLLLLGDTRSNYERSEYFLHSPQSRVSCDYV